MARGSIVRGGLDPVGVGVKPTQPCSSAQRCDDELCVGPEEVDVGVGFSAWLAEAPGAQSWLGPTRPFWSLESDVDLELGGIADIDLFFGADGPLDRQHIGASSLVGKDRCRPF